MTAPGGKWALSAFGAAGYVVVRWARKMGAEVKCVDSGDATRELRLKARELGVPVEALAQVAIAEFVRQRRRRKG